MNPLSPFTYYRRHKGQALLLLVLIGSLTLGVFVMVGVMTAVAGDTNPTRYLTRASRILAGQALDPALGYPIVLLTQNWGDPEAVPVPIPITSICTPLTGTTVAFGTAEDGTSFIVYLNDITAFYTS